MDAGNAAAIAGICRALDGLPLALELAGITASSHVEGGSVLLKNGEPSGILIDKPAGVFTSSASMHGGQESTLLSMALPLIHHGMLFVGLPYSEEALSKTKTGGTPYGATHVTWKRPEVRLSDDEKALARALGARVATIAAKLR